MTADVLSVRADALNHQRVTVAAWMDLQESVTLGVDRKWIVWTVCHRVQRILRRGLK